MWTRNLNRHLTKEDKAYIVLFILFWHASQTLAFIPSTGLWQSCAEQIFRHHFSNTIFTSCLCATFCNSCNISKILKDFIYLFLEMGKGRRKRERETLMCGFLSHAPNCRPGLQPNWHVP